MTATEGLTKAIIAAEHVLRERKGDGYPAFIEPWKADVRRIADFAHDGDVLLAALDYMDTASHIGTLALLAAVGELLRDEATDRPGAPQ